MSEPDPMRVLIADDHLFYREGLRALLGALPSVEIVGEASTGDEAVSLAADLRPDIILMDLKMPGLSGIEATRRVTQNDPGIAILSLTMYDDDDSVFAAMRAGARGYLLKDASLDDVHRAMTAVCYGGAVFSPTVAGRVLQHLGRTRSDPPAVFPDLTQREYEILNLIAQRRGNAEIAAQLYLSPKTVRNHVSNILSKLHVTDRAEAALAARAAGMGQDPPDQS